MPHEKITQAVKILIVEDFHVETEALQRELSDSDFNYTSEVVKTEKEYKKGLHSFNPDVILSPYSLASTNAVKLLQIARNESVNAPFILLAFDLSEDIAIDLLGEGIEDYILRSTVKRLPVAIKKALQRYKIQHELLLSEAKWRESEISLQEAQNIAKVGSWRLDSTMQKVEWSDEMFVIHGIEKQAVTVELMRGLTHPEDISLFDSSFEKLTSGRETDMIYRIITPTSKEVKYMRGQGRVKKNPDGSILKISGTVQDINEKHQTSIELEKSEVSLKLAQRIAKIGNWELNPVTQDVWWSEEMYEIHGIEKLPLSVELIRNLTHPDDIVLFEDGFKKVMAGESTNFVYRLVSPNWDKEKYVSGVGQIITNANGDIINVVGTVQDVTEKVLLQAKEKSDLLQRELAISAAEIGVWHLIIGPKVSAVWDNRCFEIFGITDGNLSADDFFQILHPDDLKMVREKVANGIKHGDYQAEYRIVRNGEVRVIQAQGKTSFNELGRATRLEGILIDVTDKKVNEERLKTLSLVASETVNGVLIHDPEGRIIWANKGFTKITGYTNEEVVGKEPWSILSGQETNQKLIELTYVALSKGKPFSSDNRLASKSGDAVWVHTTFTPVTDEGGNVTKIVSIVTDITKQKELQRLQREMVARLEKANAELEKKAKD